VTAAEHVADTERLTLRRLGEDDAAFVLELLNEAPFLRYIGDRGVRTLDDARRYVSTGPQQSYARRGFGLYRVELRAGGEPLGICGLIKRDTLDDVDLGFAFLQRHWSRGYAHEAAAAVMALAREVHGLERVVAITSPDNEASMSLLRKLGFRLEGQVRLTPDEPPVNLFAVGAAPRDPPAA
jgi:RimJ/RimL family protein N-acetyltransferase